MPKFASPWRSLTVNLGGLRGRFSNLRTCGCQTMLPGTGTRQTEEAGCRQATLDPARRDRRRRHRRRALTCGNLEQAKLNTAS